MLFQSRYNVTIMNSSRNPSKQRKTAYTNYELLTNYRKNNPKHGSTEYILRNYYFIE